MIGVDLCDSLDMFILQSNAHPTNMHSAAASNARQIEMYLAVEKTGYFFLCSFFFSLQTSTALSIHFVCMDTIVPEYS